MAGSVALQKAKKGKKNRKVGRNAVSCKNYEASHRRERNKLARLEARVTRFPNDLAAAKDADRLRALVRGS